MPANTFQSGHDTIEVYGIEDGNGLVDCVDTVDGFLFQMEPSALREFLADHNYTFTGAA